MVTTCPADVQSSAAPVLARCGGKALGRGLPPLMRGTSGGLVDDAFDLAAVDAEFAGAEPASAAALTLYPSSRRASTSALIAEISASTASICSPRRRWSRTASTRPDGTYFSRPRPRARGAK
jgi:hypothetical protein